jgi:hypothetical protein
MFGSKATYKPAALATTQRALQARCSGNNAAGFTIPQL